MLSVVNAISGSSKQALVLISLIVVVTLLDSQFINFFYGTDLGTPGNLHLLLFESFVILASVTLATVSAVSMHALSAVTRITRLVFSIFLILGCLYSCGIFLIPEVKFLKVTNKFATNPLLWSCSKTEQQLQISEEE